MVQRVPNALLDFDGGPLSGFRNRIINGAFQLNQRAYASGAATTVGQFTFDRWYVTATNGITFATTNGLVTVTIPSGQTLKQAIEAANLEAGEYVLSWTGTAQGRINGGAFGSSGAVRATIAGGVDASIEFNAGTVTQIQLERGTTSTAFERRNLGLERLLCQRYYQRWGVLASGSVVGSVGMVLSATSAAFYWPFPVPMRLASPVLTSQNFNVSDNTATNAATLAVAAASLTAVTAAIQATSSGLTANRPAVLVSNAAGAFIAFDAELLV